MADRNADGRDIGRIRIDIEAPTDGSDEFTIRFFAGHKQTTQADWDLFRAVYKYMIGMSRTPARWKKVTLPDGTETKQVPKTKSGKPFPMLFPLVIRRNTGGPDGRERR